MNASSLSVSRKRRQVQGTERLSSLHLQPGAGSYSGALWPSSGHMWFVPLLSYSSMMTSKLGPNIQITSISCEENSRFLRLFSIILLYTKQRVWNELLS